MKLALISDDLTGALDASVVFAAAGMRTVVAIAPEGFEDALNSGADVVAVTLNSREGSESEAVRKAAKAAALVPPGIPVFKKIDSRMKGHVRAEARAVAAAMSASHVTLCPAIPAMGRIVRDGKLQGMGVDGALDCREKLGPGLDGSGLEITVSDASSDEDLDRIVDLAPAGTVLCGARGLAAALARKIARNGGSAHFGQSSLPHPILFAIGSRDPITIGQAEALRGAGGNVFHVLAPNGEVADGELPAGDLLVQSVPGKTSAKSDEVTAAFADAIAFRAAPGRASLVLTGGETAAAVLSRLGVRILEIVGEPLPGMPASVPLGAGGSPVIVTKSGGFGAPDALLQLAGKGSKQESRQA